MWHSRQKPTYGYGYSTKGTNLQICRNIRMMLTLSHLQIWIVQTFPNRFYKRLNEHNQRCKLHWFLLSGHLLVWYNPWRKNTFPVALINLLTRVKADVNMYKTAHQCMFNPIPCKYFSCKIAHDKLRQAYGVWCEVLQVTMMLQSTTIQMCPLIQLKMNINFQAETSFQSIHQIAAPYMCLKLKSTVITFCSKFAITTWHHKTSVHYNYQVVEARYRVSSIKVYKSHCS